MGRGVINSIPTPPDYYQFDDISEIQQKLINHIAKLKNDIEWSKTSWFGFFVSKPLKDEKIQGLDKILKGLNEGKINAYNYIHFIKEIEKSHPKLHEGIFLIESHKIVKGIQIFYQGLKDMVLKEVSTNPLK